MCSESIYLLTKITLLAQNRTLFKVYLWSFSHRQQSSLIWSTIIWQNYVSNPNKLDAYMIIINQVKSYPRRTIQSKRDQHSRFSCPLYNSTYSNDLICCKKSRNMPLGSVRTEPPPFSIFLPLLSWEILN